MGARSGVAKSYLIDINKVIFFGLKFAYLWFIFIFCIVFDSFRPFIRALTSFGLVIKRIYRPERK